MSEYSDLITAASPVAWYRLNSAGTTDSSGNSRTITWVNAPASYATDPLANDSDGAADFDGTDDHGTIADADVFSPYTNSNFTVEVWANPDTNHVGAILQKSGEWGMGWGEGGGTNQFFCFIQKTDLNMVKYASESGTSSTGTWYHIAMVWDGTTLTFYKNGVDVTYLLADNAVTGMGNTSNAVYVGQNAYGAQRFNGKMDEIAVYNTALSSTEILKHYEVGIGRSTYQAPPAAELSFFKQDATISVSGSVNISAPAVELTFTSANPTLALGIDIAAPAAEVTFTAPSPTVAADNSNTFTCFDGTIYDFIDTFAYVGGVSSGGSYDVNGVYFDPYVAGGSGRPGYSFILTVPSEAALNVLVTITASATFVNNVAGNQGQINVYDLDGGSPTTLHNAISLTHASTGSDSDTRALTLGNIGFTWVAGRRYRFEVVWERNGSTQNGSTVQLDSLTLYYETGTSVTVNAPAAQVSFTKLDPTVTSGQQTILTVDNVPAITAAAFDPDVLTPGQVAIGTTTSIVSYVGLAPTLSTTQSVEQVVTSPSVLEYATYDATVDPDYTALSFKFIIKSCPCRTAADSNAITSIDLGSGLFNQEKEFAFKLGNTSSSVSTFTISATSVNNLADMVTFSIDKYGTYTPTLTIESVQSNRVTDVIWGKLTIDTDAIVDDGTFLIHVEQTHA